MSHKTKRAQEWLGFVAGLLLGALFAFVFYAGLQPRLSQAVKTKEKSLRELSAMTRTLKSDSTLPKYEQLPEPARNGILDSAQAALKRVGTIHKTLLTATPTATDGLGKTGWLTLLVVAIIMAMAASTSVWRQRRHDLPQLGAITSPLLEALLSLSTHQRILQERLKLSPRQIKRFSSKARVQHSQLRALANTDSSAHSFTLVEQVQAFQMLLLFEESRQLPSFGVPEPMEEIIRRLQESYSKDAELAQAREEASKNGIIKQEETVVAIKVNPKLMWQLCEMNSGLLA